MIEMTFYIALAFTGTTLVFLLVNPVWGIPLIFVSKPFIDGAFEHHLVFGVRLTEIIGTVVPMMVLLHLFLAKPENSFQSMPLKTIWLILVCDFVLFSGMIAYQQDLRLGASVFFRYINGFVGVYMFQAFFREETSLKWLLGVLLLAALFPTGIGIYQALTGHVWRFESNSGVARNIGIWHDAVNLRQYSLQTILASLLFMALYVRVSITAKLTVLSYLAAASIVLLKTYTKAGIATLVLWAGTWTLLQKKFGTFIGLASGLLILTIFLSSDLLQNVVQIFQKETGVLEGEVAVERSFSGRWFGWQAMMKEWSSFDAMAQLFGSGQMTTNAHNDFLAMLFHAGIIGLLLYCTLLCTVGIVILRNVLQHSTPMNIAGLMALTMWLVDSIGVVPSAYPGHQWFLWGMIGLSLRLHHEKTNTSPTLSTEYIPTVHEQEPMVGLPQMPPQRKFPILSP